VKHNPGELPFATKVCLEARERQVIMRLITHPRTTILLVGPDKNLFESPSQAQKPKRGSWNLEDLASFTGAAREGIECTPIANENATFRRI
jgi:hypothetical protein